MSTRTRGLEGGGARSLCTVAVMWLAGIPVVDRAVLQLAAELREAELVDTAEPLEHAYDREARIVALDVTDREAILRVLEDAPEELLELRATRVRDGTPPPHR